MKQTKLEISEYTDFRRFLADRLDELKRQDPKYSMQYFTQRLELGSRNYLRMIINGQRKLTERLAGRLGAALGLDVQQQEFFLRLVRFAQAGSTAEKNEALADLRKNRRFLRVHRLALDHLDYLADPLLVALREMAALDDFSADPVRLAKQLKGRPSARQVAAGLKRLVKMGILIQDPNGRLVQPHRHQESGDQLGSVPLRLYHKNMLELAAKAIDDDPTVRHLTGITLSISEEGYRKALGHLSNFLAELRRVAQEDPSPDRVYHLELALYPMTVVEQEKRKANPRPDKKGGRS
ncbi:MAG: TIGR02147 family protein [Myxococcales bacterium]|nr:MAG: TIGR02147 family protein [Myxococcales bacterium]